MSLFLLFPILLYSVASLGGTTGSEGAYRPGWHHARGDTRMKEKNFCGRIYKEHLTTRCQKMGVLELWKVITL